MAEHCRDACAQFESEASVEEGCGLVLQTSVVVRRPALLEMKHSTILLLFMKIH